jgi:hypothetical protein
MNRQHHILQCVQYSAAIALAFTAGLATQAVVAQGLLYQDANELASEGPVNLTPPAGRTLSSQPPVPSDVIVSSLPDPMQVPPPDEDNRWNYRNFGVGKPDLPTVFQSGIAENSPVLIQTVTGLTPGNNYDLYAVYWTDEDENWTIRAGTDPGNLRFYSWTGEGGTSPVAGSTQGIAASTAVWAALPPTTKESTIFTERPADPLVMLLGHAGTATANGSGQIDVHIDDNPVAGGPRRTWFDGVAYVPAGTSVAATATLDRMTGALTLNNPTSQSLQIKSYRIAMANSELAPPPTSGALNASTWTTISSTNPSWSVTAPADPANTPFATILSEDGGGTTVTLGANGGSLSFGNVWNRSPFDHVLLYLTLADDTLAVLAAQYSGPAIANGDLDGNGSIDLADFQTLLNSLHTTPGLPTRLQNYRAGDITGDGPVSFNDWVAFRTAFNAENGAGSFEAMLAQIPEPSSVVLLAVVGIMASIARRRFAGPCLAVVMCSLLAGTSNAVTLLKADVNSRVGEPATPAPPGDNTVPGFSAYTMETGTTGGLGTSTNTVNGYTITLTAVNAAGAPTGIFDDRDRATPTTSPTLNQLYDDFIFAVATGATGTGDGGGLDMLINSGGQLMPNRQYGISIYSFDTSSTGVTRSANWLDGNNANSVALTTAFAGATSPVTDDQYKFDGIFRTDASGNLLLRARETTDNNHGVFLNGFEINDEIPPPPIELTLRVNTTTGRLSIINEQTVNLDMSYYEIRSAAGALNQGAWNSLDDAESNDPLGQGWDEVPAVSSNLLSEVNLQSMTSFSPGNAVSLGNAFSPGGAQSLQFLYAGPNETALRVGNVSYVTGPDTIPGDYNSDGRVDAADYVVWRKTDGSPSGYNTWRTNFGRTSGSGAALDASAAVPEPTSAVLGALGLALITAPVVRRSARR